MPPRGVLQHALKLPRGRKQFYLRAVEIWTEHPKLGFVDALTAAMVEDSDLRLAPFDSASMQYPTFGGGHLQQSLDGVQSSIRTKTMSGLLLLTAGIGRRWLHA